MTQREQPNFMRTVFQGAYYVLVFGFVATVGYSATVGAFSGEAGDSPAEQKRLTPDSSAGKLCQIDLADLHARVYTEAMPFFQAADDANNAESWDARSKRWRADLTRVKSRCQLGSVRAMDSVKQYAQDIQRTQVAMATALRAFRNLATKPLRRIRKHHEESPAIPALPPAP